MTGAQSISHWREQVDSHLYQSGTLRDVIAKDVDSRVIYIESITEVMGLDPIIQGKYTRRGKVGTRDGTVGLVAAIQQLWLFPISWLPYIWKTTDFPGSH